MPWSGGNFTRANGNNGWVADATNGIGIEAGRHDDQDNDFKNGIDQCLNKDGSNAATGNLNFGNYRPTNINAGTAAAPAICAGNDVNTGVFGPASDTWAVATNGAERLRIDNAGRVGIANVSPKDTLHISTASTISPQDGAGGVGTTFGFNYYYSSGAKAISTGSRTVSMELGNNGGILKSTTATQTADAAVSGLNPYIQWGGFGDLISLSTANAERVRITSGGRIGIGTNSPQSYVSAINSESAFLNTVNCQSNVSGDATTHALTVIKYDNSTATTQRFIGFLMNQGASASGQINANGANAAAFGSYCDERLKENIVDLPSQLSNILALRPVEFDYKDGSGHQLGFIAQEVQQVFPDLVGESDGFLTLTDMNKNDARLIKAFQELHSKVVALEERVAELEGA